MLLLAFDVLVGTLLLGAILGLAARGRRRKPQHVRALGWTLLIPLPFAVFLHLALELPQTTDQTLFIAGVVAFAVGAALVLGADDEEDWREPTDDSPPWWPAFEREFRDYASRPRNRPRPITRV